jgi:sugar phosphate isomerase/epimerase
MKLIVFSKAFKSETVARLIALAHEDRFEGYDLCVRPAYAVNPDNVTQALPDAARQMRQAGLEIPMVTGNFDLLTPDHPTAAPILPAMDKADVRLIKLGYFSFDPLTQDYWTEVDRIRKAFDGWQELGRKHGIKICYHTHSHGCMGLNCSMLAHLIRGFDPRFIGAYIDPGHMVVEGEEFPVGAAVIRKQLSIIGLKDALLTRAVKGDHGAKEWTFVPAGEGMVDWTTVFAEVKRIGFDGPLSAHCEFHTTPEEFPAALKREVAFFQRKMKEAGL